MAEYVCPPGMDPASEKALAEMKRRAGIIEEEANAAPEITAADLADDSGNITLRPVSAGILAILERIKSPMLYGDQEPTLPQILQVLYILDPTVSESEIIDAAFGSDPDQINRNAIRWSMSIDMETLNRMKNEIIRVFNVMSSELNSYAPENAEDSAEKKIG